MRPRAGAWRPEWPAPGGCCAAGDDPTSAAAANAIRYVRERFDIAGEYSAARDQLPDYPSEAGTRVSGSSFGGRGPRRLTFGSSTE